MTNMVQVAFLMGERRQSRFLILALALEATMGMLISMSLPAELMIEDQAVMIPRRVAVVVVPHHPLGKAPIYRMGLLLI